MTPTLVERTQPARRVRLCEHPRGGSDKYLQPFLDAAIGDLLAALAHARPIGAWRLTAAIQAVVAARRTDPEERATNVRAALIQVAAQAVEWAAHLERDERSL